MNAQCPYKCWSTLQPAAFGSSSESSLPLLLGWAVGLVCESHRKSDVLSAHFDSKQSRDPASTIHLPSVSKSLYLQFQVTGGEVAPFGSGFLWWPRPIGHVPSI